MSVFEQVVDAPILDLHEPAIGDETEALKSEEVLCGRVAHRWAIWGGDGAAPRGWRKRCDVGGVGGGSSKFIAPSVNKSGEGKARVSPSTGRTAVVAMQ